MWQLVAKLSVGLSAAAVLMTSSLTPAIAQVQDRQPECIREQQFVDQNLFTIHANKMPQGVMIVSEHAIEDPRYKNQGWQKWKTEWITHDWSSTNRTQRTDHRLELHYLWNIHTKATAQVKLKNTYQEGCLGKVVTVNITQIETQTEVIAYGGGGGDRGLEGNCSPGSVTVEHKWMHWTSKMGDGPEDSGIRYEGYDVVSQEAGNC